MNNIFHAAFTAELAKLAKTYAVPESTNELKGLGKKRGQRFNKDFDRFMDESQVASDYHRYRRLGHSSGSSQRKIQAKKMTKRTTANKIVGGASTAAQIGGAAAMLAAKKNKTVKRGIGTFIAGTIGQMSAKAMQEHRVRKTEKALKANPALGKDISFKRYKK